MQTQDVYAYMTIHMTHVLKQDYLVVHKVFTKTTHIRKYGEQALDSITSEHLIYQSRKWVLFPLKEKKTHCR